MEDAELWGIYHGTHETHRKQLAHIETSGHFCIDHWSEATDALTYEMQNWYFEHESYEFHEYIFERLQHTIFV